MKTDTQLVNVLFVDDDADEFYLFNEAIEQANQPVQMVRARDGNDMMQILESGNLPDLIFMDLNMPYKDGFETLVELKSHKNYNSIPVIIFSTSKSFSEITACYQQGANMYVVKPETFDDITNMVNKVFSLEWTNNMAQPDFADFVLKY